MLRAAQQLGCQMGPGVRSQPHIYIGLCPLHQAAQLNQARTLQMDLARGRWRCNHQACARSGPALHFLALVWQISIHDAYQLLLNNPDAGADRPNYPVQYQPAHHPLDHRIPSLLLRHANNAFSEGLEQLPARIFLHDLGLTLNQANQLGLGYAHQPNLSDILAANLPPEILHEQPLLQGTTPAQHRFQRRITIPDRDLTGAATWLTSISPRQADYRAHPGRPSLLSLPGHHPGYLLGSQDLPLDLPTLALTDDARLYLVERALALLPIMLSPQRRGAEDNVAQRTAQTLRRRNVRELHLLMHNRHRGHLLRQMLANHMTVHVHPIDTLHQRLDPYRRQHNPYESAQYPEKTEPTNPPATDDQQEPHIQNGGTETT